MFNKNLFEMFLLYTIVFSCCMLNSCKKMDILSGIDDKGNPITLEIKFNILNTLLSRSREMTLEVAPDESFINTLRILIFNTEKKGKVVYNEIHTINKDKTFMQKISLTPGSYNVYALANENKDLTNILENVNDRIQFLENVRGIASESVIKILDNGRRTLLMEGGPTDIEIKRGDSEKKIDIELTRISAKLEIIFEDYTNGKSKMVSATLGNIPAKFSLFHNDYFPLTDNDNGNNRKINIENIELGKVYSYYLPPFFSTSSLNVDKEKMHLTFVCDYNGVSHTEVRDFRESDLAQNIHDVKRNYLYRYTIRLKSIHNPLEIECHVLPWESGGEKNLFVDQECTLSIKEFNNVKHPYHEFTLQHVNKNANYTFPTEKYFLQFNNSNVWASVNNSSYQLISSFDNYSWQQLSFQNDKSGKSIIRIRHADGVYFHCFFNGISIYQNY